MGKVSAARASTRLISNLYKSKRVDIVIFTGVAGAAHNKLNQWDIVIANKVLQHDMDATPLYPKFVIPAINSKYIEASKKINNWAEKILQKSIKKGDLKNYNNVYQGLIATGDQFISDKNKLVNLCQEIPNLMAVEMEGAAFAQVAIQEKVPWLIIRTISDKADHSASQLFEEFIEIYKNSSWDLIKVLINNFILYSKWD